ncbi:MAG: hypothetical protein ACRYG5_06615 [Janthinobacterium lividum]
MRKIFSDRREWMFIAIVVATLVGFPMASWFVVLMGGNPYHPGPVKIYDARDQETLSFRPGDWVYVKRYLCVDRDILTEQSPALFDVARKAHVPLNGSLVVAKKGCSDRTLGFEIPGAIPLGRYEYRNVTRFQDNLVGRDEWNVYPPITLEISK